MIRPINDTTPEMLREKPRLQSLHKNILRSIRYYTSKYAIKICLIFAICTSITALPIPYTTNCIYFTIDLWLTLFFGACLMPPITGIMICSMPKNLRPLG